MPWLSNSIFRRYGVPWLCRCSNSAAAANFSAGMALVATGDAGLQKAKAGLQSLQTGQGSTRQMKVYEYLTAIVSSIVDSVYVASYPVRNEGKGVRRLEMFVTYRTIG